MLIVEGFYVDRKIINSLSFFCQAKLHTSHKNKPDELQIHKKF